MEFEFDWQTLGSQSSSQPAGMGDAELLQQTVDWVAKKWPALFKVAW